MKSIQLIVAGLVLGTVLGPPGTAAAEKVTQSQWAEKAVRIDGAIQEWGDSGLLADKGSKAEYALRNDGEFLYVLMVFRAPTSLSTYEASGMKIFYSLAGKKSKSAGFHFLKKSVSAEDLIAGFEKSGEALTDEKKAEIRKQKAYMTYEGVPLEAKKGPVQAVAGPAPTFRDKLSVQLSVVEFKIPLARLSEAGRTAAPGEVLTLGFEWGGMTAEMRTAYMARMADGASRAGGTGGGDLGSQVGGNYEGGGDAGMGGGMGGRPDPRTRKHSFWIDVKLGVRGQ